MEADITLTFGTPPRKFSAIPRMDGAKRKPTGAVETSALNSME